MARRSYDELIVELQSRQLPPGEPIEAPIAEIDLRPRPRPRSSRTQKKQFDLPPDQFRKLMTVLADVQAQRTERSERVSGSALVRIAIDVLIEHASALKGNTEAELAASLRAHLDRAWR